MLTNQAGLITGGADGIGRAAALAYAREGAAVLIADLDSSRAAAEETVRLVHEAGGTADFLAADVTQASGVERLVAACADHYGSVDFAFNNAGAIATGFTADIEEDDFDHLIAVDLKGVWLCMKYELRYMTAHGGGAIVNTSSEAGIVGTPLAGPYVAAKHGVIGLTRTAAGEYANFNVRVNAVAPGTVATPMVLGMPKQSQDVLMAPQPMNRLGRPEEIAEAVVWLSSDRASFVTGTVLCVDGGATSNAQSYDPSLSPSR